MSKQSISINSLAKQIAQQLDNMDKNPDGKVSSKVWNDIFHVQEKGGKEIKSFITVENAEKSIRAYLTRNEKNQQGKNDLAQKWMDELTGKADKELTAKALPSQDNSEETAMEGEIQEIVITSKKRPVVPEFAKIETPDIDLKPTEIQEVPVSTAVAGKPEIEATQIVEDRTDVIASLNKIAGTLDINKYVEMAKVTKTSTAKASNEPIHANILEKAFNNVIKNWMKRANKSKSILLDTARYFLKSAKEQQVDAFILMGISMQESACGTSRMALSKNNALGLTPNGRDGITCQSVADSISIGARTLHRNIYNKGLDSIGSVGMRGNYCCGDRSNWVKNVTYFANLVRDEYNKLLAEEKRIAQNQSVPANDIEGTVKTS